MPVTRDAQVPGAANIESELGRVVADEARDVPDQLHLLFVLVQRTVAAVDAQARSEVEAAVPFDEAAEEPGRKVVVEIQSGNTGILRGRGAEVERENVDLVREPSEAEVRGRVAADRSVESGGKTVVLDLRDASERDKLLAAEAVAAEHVQALVQPIVEPYVERVVVERFAAGRDEVVARAVLGARPVRQRNQLQNRERLGRQLLWLNHVVGELRALSRRRAAPRVEDVHAVRAQISVARRGSRHCQ